MNRKRLIIALSLACATGTLAACAKQEAAPRRDDPEVMEMRKQVLERKVVEDAPTEPAPVTGEVPAGLLGMIRDDLARRTDGAEATLVVAEAASWLDGSLGCPVPGRVYTQVTTPGYRVVFEAAGERWDYRATETGGYLLCDDSIDFGRGPGYPTQ